MELQSAPATSGLAIISLVPHGWLDPAGVYEVSLAQGLGLDISMTQAKDRKNTGLKFASVIH